MSVFKAGSILIGKIVSAGQERLLYEECWRGSMIEFDNGSRGFLDDRDLLWYVEPLGENAEYVEVPFSWEEGIWLNPPSPLMMEHLARVAQLFLEKRIKVMVLMEMEPGISEMIVGRRQLCPDPRDYIEETPNLTFGGLVELKGNSTARVVMDIDWEMLGYDKWTRIIGSLAKTDCPEDLWKRIANGMRLQFTLGTCDPKKYNLTFRLQ